MADPIPLRPLSAEDAAPVPPAPASLDGAGEGDDGEYGGGGGPPAGLPEGCPVTPLGKSPDGKQFYYLDAGNRLVVMAAKDHSRLGVLALFDQRWPLLQEYWPRLTKIKDPKSGETEYVATGWKPERAAEELMGECGRKGTINVSDRVRGPGAWRDTAGGIILHCGDRVLIDGKWHRPGEFDGRFYPAHAPTPVPSMEFAAGGTHAAAAAALDLFQRWPWKRPDVDPWLLLGALGAAKLGGALPWRPTIWVTGDFGSGKSTLLKRYADLCGEGGVHITVDASPANIWQRAKQSSFPVLLDEAEPEAEGSSDSRKMAAMVKLARAASSGGRIGRGGSDHNPVDFIVQGCFVFGSILLPPLMPQDRSRITVLELGKLEKGSEVPGFSPAKMKAMGEQLTRRLIDGWPRLDRIFQCYRVALMESGHSERSADQYGVLLACADLLLKDRAEPQADELAEWCRELPPERDTAKDHDNCIAYLLTASIDPFRNGGRKTIAEWVRSGLRSPAHDTDPLGEANRALESYGLSVELGAHATLADGHKGEPTKWLCVADSHRGLMQLFEGSHWAGRSGTSNPWAQALRRVDGAIAGKGKRFAGYYARCTRLPIAALFKEGDGE